MTLFQIIILIIILSVIIKAGRKFLKKEISLYLFLIWLIFWMGIAVLAVFPVIINRLADYAGVGRGVDLMIYLALMALFYNIFKINDKTNKIEQNITKVVSEVGIIKAEKK